MIQIKKTFVLAFAAVSSSAFCADLGLANNFNAFIFGNATTYGGHSQGSIAVGGNWNMNYEAQQNSSPRANLPTAPDAGIYVGGNVITNSYAKVLRGNAYIGGSLTGSLDIQNGYNLYQGDAYVKQSDFSNQYLYSTGQASAMAALSAITIGSFENNLNINLANNNLNGALKVYNLDASLFSGNLSKYATVNFSGLTNDTTIVMNVLGSGPIDWNWTINGGVQSKIVWNFLDTDVLTLGRQLHGSILAPNTHVIQDSGSIDGTLIAGQWTNLKGQELHSVLFMGDAPASSTPVPEPATMAVMGLGIASFLRKRRKASN